MMNGHVVRITRWIVSFVFGAIVILESARATDSHIPGALPKTFQAVYERVASPEDVVGDSLVDGALSGDGRRAMLLTRTKGRFHLHLYDVDARQLTALPLPEDYQRIGSLTMSRDGSRGFFVGEGGRFLYKIEQGRVTTILDVRDHAEINGCFSPRTTADGAWVYFAEDRDDLWRVAHTGGPPQRMLADEQVPRDRGQGAHLGEFDISADGSTIAFLVNGYRDPAGGHWVAKCEVFIARSGNIRQITEDPRHVTKHWPTLSGDGSTLVYAVGPPQSQWCAVPTAGEEPRHLAPLGHNSARPALSEDGAVVFYVDSRAEGGRLLNTDGSGAMNLFVSGVDVGAHGGLTISDRGDRVLFRLSNELYVGFLNPLRLPAGTAEIGPVHFASDPPPNATAKDSRYRLAATIRGAELARVATGTMLEGRIQEDPRELAICIPHGLQDKGSPPDAEAGDGLYTAWAWPGRKPQELSRQRVRIGARTNDARVTIADFRLVPAGPGESPDDPDRRPPLDPDKIVFDPAVGRELIDDEVLVTVYRGVQRAELEGLLQGLGFAAQVLDTVPSLDLYKIGVPANRRVEVRERLALHPMVAAAGYNTLLEATITFNDPVFDVADLDDWGLRKISAEHAWDITTGGALIAVIDSGVQLDHEELLGKTVNPYSYATNSTQMQMGPVQVLTKKGLKTQWICAHGTHVTVTAAGIANNRKGTAGVSPNSPVIPIQYLYYVPELQRITNTVFDVNVAIERALVGGAQVINLSLGKEIPKAVEEEWRNPATRQRAEQQILQWVDLWLEPLKGALDAAHARRAIICKAAGNQNLPARFDEIAYSRRAICVAATDPADRRCDFSNYGEYTTVSAPGKDIYSATSAPEGYVFLDGTSMATPHVTGIIALLKTLKPDLTLEEARDILLATGRKLNTDPPIGPLVNAHAALVELQRRIAENLPPPAPLPPLIPQPPAEPTPPVPPPGSILDDPEPWKHAEVQRLIDEWLARAIPKLDSAKGPWFFDKYGRVLNNKNIYATQPPDWAADRHKFLWERARQFESTNLGTMYDFVVQRLKRK